MKTKLKIACTLMILSLAGNVMAESVPSAVTGVRANASGNEITVEWDAVTSDPISYYRVYYSGESILENEGLFDDFETTEGDETSLTFSAPRDLEQVYVAVIAVANSGLESEFFTEEAQAEVGDVVVPTPAVPKEVVEDMPEVIDDSGPVRLLKAEVVSPTEIVTTFSMNVTVEQSRAPEGLKIEDPTGNPLQIKSITIDQNVITIHTEAQTRGTVYNVQYSEPFEGKDGQQLDASDRSALVTGHSEGKEPPETPAVRQVHPTSPPDVSNATIEPQIQPNGAYSVVMKWDVDNTPGDLYGIVVYQTRDGQTFGPPSLLPIDIGGLQLQNVTPGFFGLYVQTVNVYGYVSPGVFQYANLPQYIPGYGFQGNLSFGTKDSLGNEITMDSGDISDEVRAEETEEENLATVEVITEDTPMQELEGVDHSAAMEEAMAFDLKNVAILAGGTSVIILMLISAFVFIPRKAESSL